MDLKNIRAEAWTSHAKTTVLVDDETGITGKRVVAECETEEIAALFAAAPDLLATLETLVKTMGRSNMLSDFDRRNIEAARAAIINAKGGV